MALTLGEEAAASGTATLDCRVLPARRRRRRRSHRRFERNRPWMGWTSTEDPK